MSETCLLQKSGSSGAETRRSDVPLARSGPYRTSIEVSAVNLAYHSSEPWRPGPVISSAGALRSSHCRVLGPV